MKVGDFKEFKKAVQGHAKKHGRVLPWRQTTDPYKILVSEVMLQQTQVDRVMPKYKDFLAKFPTVRALANASLGDVLKEWSGLGYNRRARMLWLCAQEVVKHHNGKFPRTKEGLVSLPGVGPYTAGAVLAFAFNTPEPVIETNIRTVYLFHFFPGKDKVSDKELLPLISRTLDKKKPREWYNALMDYGTWIKKTYGNHSARSKHHTKQSKFEGSERQVRGAILRALIEGPKTGAMLAKSLKKKPAEFQKILQGLVAEGMVKKVANRYQLP